MLIDDETYGIAREGNDAVVYRVLEEVNNK